MSRGLFLVVERDGGDARFLRAAVGEAETGSRAPSSLSSAKRAQVEQPRLDLLHAEAEDQLEARLHAVEGEQVERAGLVAARAFPRRRCSGCATKPGERTFHAPSSVGRSVSKWFRFT